MSCWTKRRRSRNPDTRAARAGRSPDAAEQRLVVTGTPAENHLGDLSGPRWHSRTAWFASPPSQAFCTASWQAASAMICHGCARWSAVPAAPGQDRPGILPDLPDRQVIRADCWHDPHEQVGAYEAVVADMMGALQRTARRGQR